MQENETETKEEPETEVKKPEDVETKEVAMAGPKTVIKFGDGGLQLTTMEDVWRFAGYVQLSESCPRSKKGLMKREDIFVAIVNGRELGLTPMCAIQNTAVINGRPSVFGEIPLALCRASGLMQDFEETMQFDDSGKCIGATCRTLRKGTAKYTERTFTEADARRAGLFRNDLYEKYPQRMLPARARTFTLRDAYPDVLKGVYTYEEAESMEPIEVQATVVEPPRPRGSNLASVTEGLKEESAANTQEAPPKPVADDTGGETGPPDPEAPKPPTRSELEKMTKGQLAKVVSDFDLKLRPNSGSVKSICGAVGVALEALDAPPE